MKCFNLKKIGISLSALVLLAGTALPLTGLAQSNSVTDGDDLYEMPEMVVTASADPSRSTFQEIVSEYIVKALNGALVLLFGLTVLVFMYGLMKYMFKGADSDTARSEGRKLMLWGIVGIVSIVSVWSLVAILSSTIGHTSKGIPQFKTNSLK